MGVDYTSMETKDWLLFVGPLAGILIGSGIGLIGQSLERRARRDERRREYLTQRLEEFVDINLGFTGACEELHRGFTHSKEPDELRRLFSAFVSAQDSISIALSTLGVHDPDLARETFTVLEQVTSLNAMRNKMTKDGRSLTPEDQEDLSAAILTMKGEVVRANYNILEKIRGLL